MVSKCVIPLYNFILKANVLISICLSWACRGGGDKGADCPRASYSEGPQIVRSLFLRILQNTLKALILNEILFGA